MNPATPPLSEADLNVLLQEQRRRWEERTPVQVERLLEQTPSLRGQKEALLDLINHEIVLRCEFDTPPTCAEYVQRFPELQSDLELLFEVQAVLEEEPTGEEPPGEGPPGESSFETVASEAVEKRDADWPQIPNYAVIELLGQGGMGVVYKALDGRLKRPVALKMIRGGRASADERRRFQSEAEAVARLDHPGIIQIYEIGEYERQPFFALEFVDGGTLGSQLQGMPQPVPATVRLIESLARAVHFAHGLGIIHRDLKPANILLQKVGESPSQRGETVSWVRDGTAYLPKIADFGLAKHLENETDVTQSQAIVGTPSYMAPEQAGDFARRIGPTADVYALGAILYEMLTGRPPFRGENVLDTLDQVRTQEPVPPRRLQPRVPRDLETICLKCLRKDPAQRYPSAEALAEDVARFQRHEPILARPTSILSHLWLWCRRRPAVAFLSALLILGTLVSFGAMVYLTLWALHGEALAKTQLYDTRINLAQRHWRDTQSPMARDHMRALLDELRGELNDRRDFEWYYLWSLLHPDKAEAPAEACLAYHPHGILLAAGCRNEIHLWKTADLEARGDPTPDATLQGHTGKVVSVAFSPQGDRLLSAALDRTVRLWDAAKMKTLKVLPTLPDDPTGVAYSPVGGLMASACKDGLVRLWEPDGSLRLLLDEHTGPVNDLAFSSDGQHLVTAGNDRSVIVWDVATGDVAHKLQGHTGQVLCVAVHGQRLASAGLDKTVHLWDLRQGKLLHVFPPLPNLVMRLAFRADGKRLACVCLDQSIRIWETNPTAKMFPFEPFQIYRGRFEGASFHVGLAFAPSGERLASVSRFRTLQLWDPEQAQESHAFELPAVGKGLALCPNQPLAAVASFDKNVHLWNWRTNQHRLLPGHDAPVEAVAFAGDGTLASADREGKIRIWDLAQGKTLRTFAGNGKPILALEYHPGGHRLATGGEDGAVHFWEAAGGRELYAGPAHQMGINDLAFSMSGRRLASAGMDGMVCVCDAETGRETRRLHDPGRTPLALAFSADDELLAAGDKEGSIRLWNARSGRRLLQLEGHDGPVQGLTISRNRRRLASASADGTVRLWDLTTGLQLLILRGHGRDVNSVLFAQDDTVLISLGRSPTRSGQIRVWDSTPGRSK